MPPTRFDPKRHLIKVQGGRMYLPVSARLIWFRHEHPDWGIETEPVALDTERQYAIFRAKIYDAEGKLMATGTKDESIRDFPDYIPKAETGAVGRALALCGYGTQFAPELDEIDMRQAARGGVQDGRFADGPQPIHNGRQSAPDDTDAQRPADGPACQQCGKALTKSQHDLSVRHYDRPLCPACQRDHGRQVQSAAATAGGAA